MNDEGIRERWLRIDLSAAPALTDALASFLEDNGAAGVFQEAGASPSNDSCPEYTEEPSFGCLTAHLPLDGHEQTVASLEQYLEDLRGIFPDIDKPTYRLQVITACDWGEEWKKYFHPFRIGQRFVIKPTWEPYLPANDDIIIEIDPGMAFGTGKHHSTSLCLTAMEEVFRQNPLSGGEVLDVGTGTGILGIAAAKLGAGRVLCLDIDERAVAIARKNAKINNVQNVMEVSSTNISTLKQPYNLIVANLTAKLLSELRSTFISLLAPAGRLIISGIIELNTEEIEDAFLSPPLCLLHKLSGAEWLCYVLEKD